MIKHIVMWDIDEGLDEKDKLDRVLIFKEKIESLKDKIDVVLEIEVGIDILRSESSKDLVLYSVFKDFDDLKFYQEHEEHLKAVSYGKDLLKNRIVIDYEF